MSVRVIITSPSLDCSQNVSGMAAVTRLLVSRNTHCQYRHFPLGKKDGETRNIFWLVRTLAAYLSWAHVILTERCAIVHFNLAFDRRSLTRDLPLILMARLSGRRVIGHIHGGEFLAAASMPSWLKALVTFVLRGVPIIVLSTLERGILSGVLPRSEIFVLPNCVENEQAKTFERGYDGDQPLTLLFLGRISVSKGIDAIYRSLEILKEKGIGFRFVVAGAGPEENAYVRKCREMLGDVFEFRGVVSGAEKTALLKGCDVFLLPSLFEGMPIALLESMAFGLVPITSDVGSIATVIRDRSNGILVESPEAMAAAIEKLSRDRQHLQSLSRNAREYVLQNHAPDKYLEELNAIYEYDDRFSIARCI